MHIVRHRCYRSDVIPVSLRAIPLWRESVAISSFFNQYGIASVAALLRNDITTQTLIKGGNRGIIAGTPKGSGNCLIASLHSQ